MTAKQTDLYLKASETLAKFSKSGKASELSYEQLGEFFKELGAVASKPKTTKKISEKGYTFFDVPSGYASPIYSSALNAAAAEKKAKLKEQLLQKAAEKKAEKKVKKKKHGTVKKPIVASTHRLMWLREDWIAKHQPGDHTYCTILSKVPPHVLDLHIEEIKDTPWQARLFHD